MRLADVWKPLLQLALAPLTWTLTITASPRTARTLTATVAL